MQLALIAQISNFEQIEPLPDIDFNIRVGNTLIGYSKLSDVIDSQEGTLGFGNEQIEEINIVTKEIDSHFAKFRIGQTHNIYAATLKNEITKLLKNLQHKLNVYLAEEYGIFKSKDDFEILLNSWVTTHRPFHWFVEFFPIMSKGGFCIIIGNPPYVEYSKVKETYSIKNYKTELCGNLYTFVIERSMNLANQNARIGMIVPHSLICTDRMEPIQGILNQKANPVWYSTYDIRPSKLFIGVDQRLCIFLCGLKAEFTKKYSTKYYRWKEEERKTLFSSLEYVDVGNIIYQNSIPKIGNSAYDKVIWDKLNYYSRLKVVYQGEDYKIFYHNAPRYWIRAMNFVPYFWNERDGEQISSQIKSLGFRDKEISEAICSILNSSLFYWWFIVLSDSRHLNKREIDNFPFGIEALEKEDIIKLSILCNLLMEDYKKNAYRKLCQYAKTGRVIYDEFYPKKSKPIIDKIDKLLANHYKLSAEEMDYIINFDYRFRVGDTDDDSED